MGAAFFTDPTSWDARKGAVANSLKTQEVQRRKAVNRVKDHQARRQQQAENRRLATEGARFSPQTHESLQSRILRMAG
ncbi:hypothetical protein AB2C96_31955, partial [Pseudomonas aeruginosa]